MPHSVMGFLKLTFNSLFIIVLLLTLAKFVKSEANVKKNNFANKNLQFGAPFNLATQGNNNANVEEANNISYSKEFKPQSNATARFHSKLSSIINRLDTIKSFPLIANLASIVQIRDQKSVIGNDAEGLGLHIDRYLRSHSIRIRLPEELTTWAKHVTTSRGLEIGLEKITALNSEEGRGRIKKLILPIILLLVVKFILLIPVFLSGIALVSLNGLWAGVTALFVATALGLRALFGRDTPGYAPRFALVQPSFQPHYVPSDAVQVQADFVPVWNRNGVQPEMPYRGYPPISPQ